MEKYIQIYSKNEDRAKLHGQYILDDMFENKKIQKKLKVYRVRPIKKSAYKCYDGCIYRVYAKS